MQIKPYIHTKNKDNTEVDKYITTFTGMFNGWIWVITYNSFKKENIIFYSYFQRMDLGNHL